MNVVSADKGEEKVIKLDYENKILKAEKANFYYLLKETIQKLKKKNNNLENALSLLNEQEQEEVLELFKELGVKL